MPRIQQLPQHVVNQIAAGEVIERPASVVKELMENSIDAGATRIEVDIQAGGAELIRVTDNGGGIDSADMPLSVQAHATSKISAADDLFRVRTLGFRGEALASIAEVSRLVIRSRPLSSELAAEVNVDAGAASPVQPCGGPLGTMVEVRDLFCSTPVRRKFLKTQATEFGAISEAFSRIALAHPDRHFVLRHNAKTVFELPAVDRLEDRLTILFGAELQDRLMRVESEFEGSRLTGFAAHPDITRATRKGQHLLLNGRWIQDRGVQHAITEAYRGLVMVGRQPVCFLFLELPPDAVDVNVHPTKVEVRFRDTQAVYRLVLSAIRNTLLRHDLAGTLKLDRASQPGLGGASPGGGFAVDPTQRAAVQSEVADWAKSQLANWEPPPEARPAVRTVDESDFAWRPRLESAPASDMPRPPQSDSPPAGPRSGSFDPSGVSSSAHSDLQAPAFLQERAFAGADVPAESTPPQPSIDDPLTPLTTRAMQIHDTYLVVETPDGLQVVDQHALHERVLYEQLRNRILAGNVESQRLLIPEPVELSPVESAAIQAAAQSLVRVGLHTEPFGGNTWLVSAVPAMLSRTSPAALLHDLAEHLGSQTAEPTRRDILDELLHMMACKAAIKAGQRLSAEEIDTLLAKRHLVDDSHHCPHGRPTALRLSRDELDRQFGRLGAR
jgi:DNA mismatch repair protein MutL